ncbi:MAG TPA: XRE family transcriptional regulator [Chloroflexi bacterium]|nr:XRE family transcriptional regulator [Chloroflexota bacterium]
MYDPEPLVRMLEQLRVERNESYREASLNAGLDHEAMRRYCIHKKRPQMQSLIALADHFGVNPNQLLELAGYSPLAIFERAEVDPESVPSDVKELMDDLARIADPALRKQVIEAVRVLIGGYLESLEPT